MLNTETIERLLIDRQLGELSEDSSALLDAYLRTAPGMAAGENELARILQLAGHALRTTGSASDSLSLPGLDLPRMRQAMTRPRPPRWLSRFSPLLAAAAIMSAFFLGGRFPVGRDGILLPAKDRSPSTPPAVAAGPDEGIWSVGRYEPSRAGRSRASTQLLRWTSPLLSPVFGDRS